MKNNRSLLQNEIVLNSEIHIVKDSNNGGYYALVKNDGKILTNFEFSQVDINNNGIIVKDRNDHCGLYNLRGERILECKYEIIRNFSEELIFVKDYEGNVGLVNSIGAFSVPLTYKEVKLVQHPRNIHFFFILVKDTKGNCGLYSQQQEILLNCQYTDININWQDEFITINGNCGLYDFDGNKIVDPQYNTGLFYKLII